MCSDFTASEFTNLRRDRNVYINSNINVMRCRYGMNMHMQ